MDDIIMLYYHNEVEKLDMLYEKDKTYSKYYTLNITDCKKYAKELGFYLPFDEIINIFCLGYVDVIKLEHLERTGWDDLARFFIKFDIVEWETKQKKKIKYMYHSIFNYKLVVLPDGKLVSEDDYKKLTYKKRVEI
jgi:hypothetical protein